MTGLIPETVSRKIEDTLIIETRSCNKKAGLINGVPRNTVDALILEG